MKVTYCKLQSGDWGIKVAGTKSEIESLESGDTFSVLKKDGTRKDEVINKVLWKSDDGETAICATKPSYRTSGRGKRSSHYCGDRCPVSGLICNAKNGQCHDCI
jgi:hypothetical protein